MRILSLLFSLLIIVSTGGCSAELRSRADVIALYQKNADTFLEVAEKGDFATLEKIRGVIEVDTYDDHIDIYCGGAGFDPSTSYYGIFYSETDNLTAIWCAGPKDELVPDGNGFHYKEQGGDNQYYVESLGNHYFYYEGHF